MQQDCLETEPSDAFKPWVKAHGSLNHPCSIREIRGFSTVRLVTLTPRYAELLRRIDLDGEEKREVGRQMKLKPATLDVVLHCARYALRAKIVNLVRRRDSGAVLRLCFQPTRAKVRLAL